MTGEPMTTAGDGTIETTLIAGEDGQRKTQDVYYREMVARRALAGQGSSLAGEAHIGELRQGLFGFAPADGGEPEHVIVSSVDEVGRLVSWAAERAVDGSWALYVWDALASAHWDLPAGWHGEAPVSPGMPWLRVSR